ncbi:MAG: hypothetical protein D6694_15500 [Gammaproteobacteria bacterium]|nr:MAG: hypothetical protein D6694_15500 [Gammaproteobacteria bacterium]
MLLPSFTATTEYTIQPTVEPTQPEQLAPSLWFPEVVQSPKPLNWTSWSDPEYQFEFMYPPGSTVLAQQKEPFLQINLPVTQKTCYSFMEVFVSKNVEQCKSPYEMLPGDFSQSLQTPINDINFLYQTSKQGAAGTFYEWEAYSTERDSVCISVNFTLASTSPMMFATPPAPCDEQKEREVFGLIISTLHWLP